MSKRDYIIPVFVPHLGCPHDCVFCNQEEITGVDNSVTALEVKQQIDDYLATIPSTAKRIEVAFFGGSFTGIEKEKQEKLLAVAYKRLQQGALTGIRLSTRPDYITREILDLLQEYGVTTIELGIQSVDDQVLEAAGRGHTRADVVSAVELIKEYQFSLGLQMMPGLPASSVGSDLQTAQELITLGPDFVRIYPTLVIKGTELEELYNQGEYQPLSLAQATDLTAELLTLFNQAQIPVIRIGLQPSEGINQEEVVAGPFHPSFRQLVESELMLQQITARIEQPDKLTLVVHPKDVSNLRGQKNKNLEYLRNHYNLEEITIETDKRITRGDVEICQE
ncbi:elongator complex protein 3 [Halanaerobaculum tunisiense]